MLVLEKANQKNEQEMWKKLSEDGDLLEQVVHDPEYSQSAWFPAFIFHFLFNLDLDQKEAVGHFSRILSHQDGLKTALKRDIGFRLSAMDYFSNINGMIKNPRFLEIELFEEMLKMTKEDPKTGCYNPQFLAEIAEKEIKRAKRYQQKLSLVLIDIDDFKGLNDQYGHLFGDKVLKSFAGIMKECVRKEDAVGRFGGDEFIILIPQTGRVGARFLAERVKQSLMEYFKNQLHCNEKVTVTFSAGIATYPMDSEDYEGLIRAADKALYKSKMLGKNRIFDYLDKDDFQRLPGKADRRKYSRYWISDENDISLVDEKNRLEMQGKVLNISPNGILLECSCELHDTPMLENLNLKIQKTGKSDRKDISIKADVKRYTVEDNKLKIYLGLEFKKNIESEKWQFIQTVCKEAV